MKIKLTIKIATIFIIVLTSALFSFSKKKKLSIDGVWSFVEIKTVKSDGSFSSIYPKEGIAIFSNNHYSFCWTSHISKLRTWQITDSLKLNRFNQSIVNTGTFELKEDVLSTKAIFAMNPMFTNGLAKFKCSFNGDTLLLTGLSVISSDNISHPVYANGSHFVNKLLKVSK